MSVSEAKQRMDERLETLKAVKGGDYVRLIAINIKTNLLMRFMAHLDLSPIDAAMCVIMIEELAKSAADEWALGHSKEEAVKALATLEADLRAMMKEMDGLLKEGRNEPKPF